MLWSFCSNAAPNIASQTSSSSPQARRTLDDPNRHYSTLARATSMPMVGGLMEHHGEALPLHPGIQYHKMRCKR